MQKTCKECLLEQPISNFKKHPETKDGFSGKCKKCSNKHQREYRRRTGDRCTKEYEKTPSGFIMRLYRNMKSRISGVQKEKFHLYHGKELLDKKEFYDWAISNPQFYRLFEAYKLSKFDRRLAPSVDRIDSEFGYYIGNIEFVTLSENSRRGTENKIKKYSLKRKAT